MLIQDRRATSVHDLPAGTLVHVRADPIRFPRLPFGPAVSLGPLGDTTAALYFWGMRNAYGAPIAHAGETLHAMFPAECRPLRTTLRNVGPDAFLRIEEGIRCPRRLCLGTEAWPLINALRDARAARVDLPEKWMCARCGHHNDADNWERCDGCGLPE